MVLQRIPHNKCKYIQMAVQKKVIQVIGEYTPQKLRKSHCCVPFTATFSKRRKIGSLWSERCDAEQGPPKDCKHTKHDEQRACLMQLANNQTSPLRHQPFDCCPLWVPLLCILAEGAIALLVTLSGSALFASWKLLQFPSRLIVKVIRAIFKRASAQCSDVVLVLLCPLFAHRAQSCGHSGLLSRRPPQKRPAEALRFDSAKALYVEILFKAAMCRLLCAEAIVGACLGRRETKHRYWQCAGVFREASFGDGKRPLARNRTAPAKRPAWPHRPVCGTLSQNGYGTCHPHPCDCILLESGNKFIHVRFCQYISSDDGTWQTWLACKTGQAHISESTKPMEDQ